METVTFISHKFTLLLFSRSICPTFCNPMDCSIAGLPVPYHLSKIAQVHVIVLVMPPNHLILWFPLLLLPSIIPRIRNFSNKSTVCIRWPKYWSFSFSISPSNEYSGLISLKMTGLISLLSKGLWVGYTTVQNKKFNLKKLIFVYENRSGSLWESELEKDDQKVQISSYKVNKY